MLSGGITVREGQDNFSTVSSWTTLGSWARIEPQPDGADSGSALGT
jgi:hypothetical protein